MAKPLVGRTLSKPMMGRRKSKAGSHPSRDYDMAGRYRREIGKYIRDERERANMTQTQLGEMLGMGKTGVSALELGRSAISPERYLELADVFGLPHVAFGKFLLRYTNPWLYALIFGVRSPDLRDDLANAGQRVGKDWFGAEPR